MAASPWIKSSTLTPPRNRFQLVLCPSPQRCSAAVRSDPEPSSHKRLQIRHEQLRRRCYVFVAYGSVHLNRARLWMVCNCSFSLVCTCSNWMIWRWWILGLNRISIPILRLILVDLLPYLMLWFVADFVVLICDILGLKFVHMWFRIWLINTALNVMTELLILCHIWLPHSLAISIFDSYVVANKDFYMHSNWIHVSFYGRSSNAVKTD